MISRAPPWLSRNQPNRPIHYAAVFATPEVIAYILAHGADIESKGWRDVTPLLAVASIMGENATNGKFLIAQGADTTAVSGGKNLLERAAYFGHTAVVKMIIEELPEQFESWMLRSTSDGSPVHYAASEGRTETLKVLLDAAPLSWRVDALASRQIASPPLWVDDGRLRDYRAAIAYQGSTALQRAVVSKHGDCVDLLVKFGASVLGKNEKGWTALHMATRRKLLEVLITGLPPDRQGIDVKGGENEKTPLMSVATGGHLPCVEILLDNGADDLERDKRGWTAAHTAAFAGRVEVLDFLLSRTSWQKLDPEDAPVTLLEVAIAGGFVESVKCLLNHIPPFDGPAAKRAQLGEGKMVYWSGLCDTIHNRDDPQRSAVPMACLLGEIYNKHWPIWTKNQQSVSRNPLEAAIRLTHGPLIEALLDTGWDANVKLNCNDKTTEIYPLNLAVQLGCQKYSELQQQHHGPVQLRRQCGQP